MKKTHFLLPVSILLSFIVNAQNKLELSVPQEKMTPSSRVNSLDPDFKKQVKPISKAFGDTIYYQDFAAGIPTGWSVVNNKSNNFVWKWDTIYQNGQFSSPGNVINSTTASNGFMTLPADFYNTPIPPAGAVGMDTYFESANIDLTKNGAHPNGFSSVWVTYQQSVRYCCSGANRLVLQVSTDNFTTFREYDATNAMPVSSAIASQTNIIKITNVAANATSIKIRFLSKDNSHYYWMIDDFAVIEGSQNDLSLENPYIGFNNDYFYNPSYYQIPFGLFTPIELSSENFNNGTNTLTRVRLEGSFVNVTDQFGNPGVGPVFNPASMPVVLSPNQIDTASTFSAPFVPNHLGTYRVDMLANSDSVNQNPLAAVYSQSFSISDTVLARDDNQYFGGTGPGSYVRAGSTGGTAAGDRFGNLYVIEPRSGNGGVTNIPTSITYAVSIDLGNIGVQISPKIWKYEEDSLWTAGTIQAAFAGGEVATSSQPYTIQASDIDTLLTLKLTTGSAVLNGLDSGQYVVGWEVTNTNGGNSFEVKNDASSVPFQKRVISFIDFGHQPGWGWVDANPVIRLNMGNLLIPTGVTKVTKPSTEIVIIPNPNNGLFTMTISSTEVVTYNMNVRNMLGQEVYTDIINVNGTVVEQMDLTQFEKGVYFVTLENGAEKLLKKVVVQ